jgi:hypothetical protein
VRLLVAFSAFLRRHTRWDIQRLEFGYVDPATFRGNVACAGLSSGLMTAFLTLARTVTVLPLNSLNPRLVTERNPRILNQRDHLRIFAHCVPLPLRVHR